MLAPGDDRPVDLRAIGLGGYAPRRAPVKRKAAAAPKKKKRPKTSAEPSDIAWAEARAACGDADMPEKRPKGVSLVSRSQVTSDNTMGWRLRVGGTQLGQYATAREAWLAYPGSPDLLRQDVATEFPADDAFGPRPS